MFLVRRGVMMMSAGLLFAACNGSDDNPMEPEDADPTDGTSVQVADNTFRPGNLTVDPGGTVRWTWTGQVPHNVTFDDTSVGNSTTQQGSAGSFQRTFPETGEFTYFCTVHGRAVMSGRVVVGASGDESQTAGYP